MGMGHLWGHTARASCEPLLLLHQCIHRTVVLYLEWVIREEDVAVADRTKLPCLSVLITPTTTVPLAVLEAVEAHLALEGDTMHLTTVFQTRELSRTTRTFSPRTTIRCRHLRALTLEEVVAVAVVASGDKIGALGSEVVGDSVGGELLL